MDGLDEASVGDSGHADRTGAVPSVVGRLEIYGREGRAASVWSRRRERRGARGHRTFDGFGTRRAR